ncbi:periplasmic protein [Caballeronia concitans]|uniref:Periplasmic protein n=1 Tax=Caballeronia concitans TaxID=1777133 RepID=A0A658QUT7_9BURK|nr:protein of unknown function DUF1488 [Burkholderia sp. MR1]SAL23253.1 periplasmic protein [Caballeronia concitans]
MDIAFPATPPVYQGDEPALTFDAIADGEHIACTISAEALRDHFGAASSREEDLRRAFENNRVAIEGAAEQLLTSVGRKPVMLRSGYFRFSGSVPSGFNAHRDPRVTSGTPSAQHESELQKPPEAAKKPRGGRETPGAK